MHKIVIWRQHNTSIATGVPASNRIKDGIASGVHGPDGYITLHIDSNKSFVREVPASDVALGVWVKWNKSVTGVLFVR